MASRKEQKEAARQRRLAEEQAAAARNQRNVRLGVVGGVIAIAVVVVVVLIVVSSGNSGSKNNSALASKPASKAATKVATTVNDELKGIPQHGNTLGNPNAKVTLTEYGDLECPICKAFATGAETQLINNEVKKGQVKIVYKSMMTATHDLSDSSTIFPLQQTAAYAAGGQNKAWNYILLFYHEQGTEDTPYVNLSYLTGLAKQVDGLNVSTWNTQRNNPKYAQQVNSDQNSAASLDLQGTPSLQFSGPKSQTNYFDGELSYAQVQQEIAKVS